MAWGSVAVAVAVAGLLAVAGGGRDAGGAPVQPLLTMECAPLARPAGEDPLTVALEAGERARAHEEHCPPAGPHRRLCRALWLARHLDPVVLEYRSADPSVARRAAELLAWMLEDAATVVERGLIDQPRFDDAALAEALRSLARSNARLSGNAVDRERAIVMQARASEDVLGPLGRAEGRCR